MKARILSMGVMLLASLSLVAAPAFADTSDKSDRKADKEQSKIERKADKDAKEQKHEARKDAKKQKHEARKDAKEARKDAKEQKHDDLKGAKQDRKDADEKAREDYKRAREDAREDYKGTEGRSAKLWATNMRHHAGLRRTPLIWGAAASHMFCSGIFQNIRSIKRIRRSSSAVAL